VGADDTEQIAAYCRVFLVYIEILMPENRGGSLAIASHMLVNTRFGILKQVSPK